jgi:hypothetical protein
MRYKRVSRERLRSFFTGANDPSFLQPAQPPSATAGGALPRRTAPAGPGRPRH